MNFANQQHCVLTRISNVLNIYMICFSTYKADGEGSSLNLYIWLANSDLAQYVWASGCGVRAHSGTHAVRRGFPRFWSPFERDQAELTRADGSEKSDTHLLSIEATYAITEQAI